MQLYLFNPDADMALGNHEENYMAPASIRRMMEDLALLPAWYACQGSGVLAASAYNAEFLKKMQRLFPLHARLVTEPELPEYGDVQVMPWGWNRAVRRRLLRGGVDEGCLPTPEWLDAYRTMASRAYPLALNDMLAAQGLEYVCGRARLVEGDGRSTVTGEMMEGMGESVVVKSPWSGSGKGLIWCRNGFTQETAARCTRLLKTYGCFTVEPVYNRVGDFALEYALDGQGRLDFVGYSRFMTNEKGAYAGNLLTSNEKVEEWIGQYVPVEAFMRIRKAVEEGLHTLYAHRYTGCLGVDMMVCRQEGKHPYAIHPNVEVNLRMNMGIVSRLLYKRFVAPGREGRFFVEHFPTNEALRRQHECYSGHYPLTVEDGRVLSGYLPLVPVTPVSLSQAYMLVGGG